MQIIHFFYKITSNYWVEVDTINVNYKNSFKIEAPERYAYNQNYILGNKLSDLFNLKFPQKEMYYILSDESVFVIYKFKKVEKYFIRILLNKWKLDYNVIKEKFRRKNKEKLIEIFKDDCDLNNTLIELTRYVFCDHYSFWIYNSHTDYFTLLSSSYSPRSSYKKNDKNSVYNRVLKERSYYYEDFDKNKNNNEDLRDIRFVNRLRACLNFPD